LSSRPFETLLMKILVLGSSAGGGYPQWNCNCAQCAKVRAGVPGLTVRTQSSIAVSCNGSDWILLNASPDLGTQIQRSPALHPRAGELRDTPIRAVVLMDAQIDHVTGLLSLREGPPIELWCTPCVFEDLANGLPLLPALQSYCGVHWHLLPVAGEQHQASFRVACCPGLQFHALAIPGKAPPYSPHRADPAVGDNIALLIEDLASGRRLFYAPGLAQVGEREREWMALADCVMVDGSFWSDDEMCVAGLGRHTATDMGHLPQSGPAGMIAALAPLQAPRKVLIHINNSNPILDAGSRQRDELNRHGIEVAYDGMEIAL
jgi:pyrroloquinoline quinone biosynthesis protein B